MIRKVLLISVLLTVIEMIAEIVLRYPCNHGNNFYAHAAILALFLLLSLINFKKNAVVFFISVIGLFSILIANHYNIAVDYDTWIERGMPEWGDKNNTGRACTEARKLI